VVGALKTVNNLEKKEKWLPARMTVGGSIEDVREGEVKDEGSNSTLMTEEASAEQQATSDGELVIAHGGQIF